MTLAVIFRYHSQNAEGYCMRKHTGATWCYNTNEPSKTISIRGKYYSMVLTYKIIDNIFYANFNMTRYNAIAYCSGFCTNPYGAKSLTLGKRTIIVHRIIRGPNK